MEIAFIRIQRKNSFKLIIQKFLFPTQAIVQLVSKRKALPANMMENDKA